MLVKRSGSVPRPAGELRYVIEEFLKSAKEPALLEPGEDLLPLTGDNLLPGDARVAADASGVGPHAQLDASHRRCSGNPVLRAWK